MIKCFKYILNSNFEITILWHNSYSNIYLVIFSYIMQWPNFTIDSKNKSWPEFTQGYQFLKFPFLCKSIMCIKSLYLDTKIGKEIRHNSSLKLP